MKQEVISFEDIKQFQSRSEQFHPLNWYRDMLLNEPVSYSETSNTWNVFKYEDVKRVLSDYEYFSGEGDVSRYNPLIKKDVDKLLIFLSLSTSCGKVITLSSFINTFRFPFRILMVYQSGRNVLLRGLPYPPRT